MTDWLCYCLYWTAIHRIYGRETRIPFFWKMPSTWRWAIWKFTSEVYLRAFRYEMRRA